MVKAVAYKPVLSKSDVYQGSVSTNYQKDQTTGELFKTSGNNVKTIIPEMFASAQFISDFSDGSGAINDVYTVPAGKVFIILGISATTSFQASSYGNSGLVDYKSAAGVRKARLCGGYGSDTAGSYTHNLSWASLLVMDSGEYIECGSSNAKVKVFCSVYGYEVKKSEYLGVFN